MGLCCWVKTEGPDGCGHRLEECLPSGRENVISWDQRVRGQFLVLPSRSHFPSMCFSHKQALSLFLTHTRTHTHALFQMKENDTFSLSYFLCFYILAPGVQEATLCFHVTKHTEVCVDLGEVNGLIHHSRLGLSKPHLGISLSTLKKWDCWHCLLSLKELQLSPVLCLTDDFSGESEFHSSNVVSPKNCKPAFLLKSLAAEETGLCLIP